MWTDEGLVAKPNEYWLLRRSARYLAQQLVSGHEFWDRPAEFANVHTAIVILKSCADKMESKLIKRRLSYFDY